MVFIIYLVVSSTSNSNDDMKDKDYYEKGLNHQEQIDLEINALPFKKELSIVLKQDSLLMQLPSAMNLGEVKVHFYRPSDGDLDQRKIITALFKANNRAALSVMDLKPGAWTVKLNWNDQSGKGYYFETPIIK
jgi:hypothetical protein